MLQSKLQVLTLQLEECSQLDEESEMQNLRNSLQDLNAQLANDKMDTFELFQQKDKLIANL